MKILHLLSVLALLAAASAQTVVPKPAPIRPAAPAMGAVPVRRTATLVTAAATSTHSVTLSCGASPSSGVTSYNFYRSNVSGSGYTNIGNGSTCGFTDTLVNASTTYFYVATAVAAGPPILESVFSNQFTAVIPGNPPPSAPSNLTGVVQ